MRNSYFQPYFDAGGVFVTWRQKDPKEPDLGLYGKKASSKRNEVFDSNDIIVEDFRDDVKNETNTRPKATFKRPNIAHNRTILNSLWTRELSKFKSSAGVFVLLTNNNSSGFFTHKLLSMPYKHLCFQFRTTLIREQCLLSYNVRFFIFGLLDFKINI